MKYFKELNMKEIMSKETTRRAVIKQDKKDLRRGKVVLPPLDAVAVIGSAREILMANSDAMENNRILKDIRDMLLDELNKGSWEFVLNDISSVMEYKRFNQKCDKYYLDSYERIVALAENISSCCSSVDLARNFMATSPLNLCDVDTLAKIKYLIKNKDVICVVKNELAGFDPEVVDSTLRGYNGSVLSYNDIPEGLGKLSIIYPLQLGGFRDVACIDVEKVNFDEFRDGEIFQAKMRGSKFKTVCENAYYDTKKCFRIALTTPYSKEESFYLLVSKYPTDKHLFITEDANRNFEIISSDCKHLKRILYYIAMLTSSVLNKINSVNDDDSFEVISNIGENGDKGKRKPYSKGQPHKTYVKGFIRRYKSGKIAFVRSHIRYYGYPGKDIENLKTFITIK